VRALKPVLGLLSTIFAVGYCGYLIYYFYNVSGSVQDVENNGLGPIMVGLGIVGSVFLIVLIVKLALVFAAWRSPKSRRGSDGPTRDDDDGFDPDAVIARYMARQAAEAAANPPSLPPTNAGGGPAGRTGFGRKNK